ncbi:MAG: flagellar hook-basal body protein [Bacilli bacterium]
MIKSFYTAASGMLANQRKAEILTNNMANINTPGYKANEAVMRSFPEMLMQRYGTDDIPNGKGTQTNGASIGSLNSGVYVQETIPLFLQGMLKETGLASDVALIEQGKPDESGTVLYAVENGTGERYYTRNGSFIVSPEGYLSTKDGYYVLGTNNERIPLQSDDFKVSANGEVTGTNGENFTIQVAYTNNTNELTAVSAGMYQSDENLQLAQNVDGVNFSVMQGFVEGSNVDLNSTMSNLMMTYRNFETNQKVLTAIDRSLEKTVNEIGRIK